jgi:hypothetical protein
LLAGAGEALVFFAGCSDEQSLFRWDLRVVLTVPEAVLVNRLATRSSNTYGKGVGELDRVVADRREIEPVLLANADLVIDTRQSLPSVIRCLLGLVERAASAADEVRDKG